MADEKSSTPAGIEKESISLEDGSTPPPQVRKHAHDADEAMKAFQDGEIEILDEATNKRLLRTIDWNIMPVGWKPRLKRAHRLIILQQLLCIVYGLNYLDSTNSFRKKPKNDPTNSS